MPITIGDKVMIMMGAAAIGAMAGTTDISDGSG